MTFIYMYILFRGKGNVISVNNAPNECPHLRHHVRQQRCIIALLPPNVTAQIVQYSSGTRSLLILQNCPSGVYTVLYCTDGE